MKMFYLQHKDEGKFMARLLVTRKGYILTEHLNEATFFGTEEEAREMERTYPEFDVMCLGVTPLKSQWVTGYESEVVIPGANQVDVDVAVEKIKDGLCSLQDICDVMFCETDDNDALSVYKGIKYCQQDHRVYIELEYPTK